MVEKRTFRSFPDWESLLPSLASLTMGARESTTRNGPGNDTHSTSDAAVPDYYQLLEVDENATADEIKVNRIQVSSKVQLLL